MDGEVEIAEVVVERERREVEITGDRHPRVASGQMDMCDCEPIEE